MTVILRRNFWVIMAFCFSEIGEESFPAPAFVAYYLCPGIIVF
jgi:hypothetical protein